MQAVPGIGPFADVLGLSYGYLPRVIFVNERGDPIFIWT